MALISCKKCLCQELTEKDWECLTDVLISDVWRGLGWGEDNSPEMFLGGRGGPPRLGFGTWYVKLDGCYEKRKLSMIDELQYEKENSQKRLEEQNISFIHTETALREAKCDVR